MKPGKLEFNEELHEYRVDGLLIPSVTQIISEAGLSNVNLDDPAVIQAGQFGTAAHKVVELHDRGTLDIATVDDALRPYLEGWYKFRKESGIEILEIEKRLFHPAHWFSGTIDRVVRWHDKIVILDIKTSVKFPATVGLQTAAYMALYNADGKGRAKATQRCVVLLKPDSTYLMEKYNNKMDFNIFLSALQLLQWKNNNLK